MKHFKDNAGRSWAVAVNVNSIKRVKSIAQVNLLEAVEGELIAKLADDPILLCGVLWALVEPEATAAGVSDEQFGEGLAGDAIDLATAALLEEIVDFFPSGKRELMKKALAKLETFRTKVHQRLSQHMDNPATENRLLAKLETELATLNA